MRHSILKHFSLYVCPITALGALPGTALAQSVWKKVKDAAKQVSQQGQQPQQTQQPGQQQPGQKMPRQGHAQQQVSGQFNDSGPFKPPIGTKIEEKIMAPLQERAQFEVSPHGVHVATTENAGSRAVV
jgi:hypothetical protein